MVSYQVDKVFDILPNLLSALPVTLLVIVMTTILGLLLGSLLTWAQLSHDSMANQFAKAYVFALRCTPPIVLLFLVFYGLPEFLHWWLGLDIDGWSRAVFAILTLLLLFVATISEVLKAAYLAIPKGQTEAGLSIGLSPSQTFFRIILPQLARLALPNLTTAILNLIKDSALAYTIGLVDVMGAANLLISRQMGNFSLETYTAVALIYWGIALLISLLSQGIEYRLSRSQR